MNKSTVHVSSSLGPKRRLFGPVVLTVICVIVVAVVLAVTLYFVNRNKKTEPVQQALTSSDTSYNAGDYERAYKDLKAVENQAKGRDEKIRVYDGLAAAATSTGNIGEALHYYELKHKLAPETAGEDAYSVGLLYERADQPDKALEQYRKALEYEKEQAKITKDDSRVTMMEGVISDLEAQQQ